jgi:hypothetical protein
MEAGVESDMLLHGANVDIPFGKHGTARVSHMQYAVKQQELTLPKAG